MKTICGHSEKLYVSKPGKGIRTLISAKSAAPNNLLLRRSLNDSFTTAIGQSISCVHSIFECPVLQTFITSVKVLETHSYKA